jgi:hypothetical protein
MYECLHTRAKFAHFSQPGFMRTEMTKGVGFDKYYDAGGGELSTDAP